MKYSAEKIIPLIILFEYKSLHRSIKPICIERIRKKDFIEYYEVKWYKMSDHNVYGDKDYSELDEYITLERLDTFEKYYPDLVNNFKEKLANKIKKRMRRAFNIIWV